MRTLFTSLILTSLTCGGAMGADAKAGQAVYDRSCKSCHGADGTANPAIAKMMKTDIHDLKSAEVQSRSDADLKKIVTEGVGKMKAVPAAAGSADDVIAYIRSLKK